MDPAADSTGTQPRRPLLLRDVRPPQPLGVAAAAGAVALTTLVIYPLAEVAPVVSTGVVYLLPVLLVATYWGLALGLITAVASTAAFNWFHIPPTGRFTISDPENIVALVVFLAAAVIASTVADVARARADEAERRREEADLAARTAQTLLGGRSLDEALPEAARHLARELRLAALDIELHAPEPGLPGAIALDLRHGRAGALVVGDDSDPRVLRRLRERVVPSLEALLAAALDREALQAEVVETQALRRTDVVKTALLRAVSHDLRSPLTAIIAAGDAVRSPTLPAGERDDLGRLIVGEATRLSNLVDKLLDLSRLQAGAAEPRRDWCSIDEVVHAAVEHLDDPGAVRVSLDRDLPLVRADAAQLERALGNLLENAQRYSAPHPAKVRARVVGGRMVIRVIDRGPGIDPRQQPHIFEPFHRGDGGGSGLGLAIVKGFVEANGGRVRVESLPGQGAVFVVELPLAEQPAIATTGGEAR